MSDEKDMMKVNEPLDNEQEQDFEADFITLVDEEGKEHEFEVVDVSELEGQEYYALVPVFDQPEEMLEDSGELVILKVMEENGEEFLDAIEDELEFNRVADYFMDRLADTFDFHD